MQPKKRKLFIVIYAAIIINLCLYLIPNYVSAQEADQSPSQDPSKAQNTNKKPDDDQGTSGPLTPVGLTWTDSYIRQIGYSGVLAGSREGIGWGSFYIPTASVTGVVETLDTTAGQPGGVFTAALFQATVVYDHKFGTGNRVALQYSPSMAIADGQVVGNFSNQNTNLDILLYERPRWNIRFSDSFLYYYSQQAGGFPFFDVDAASSGIISNMFLTGPDRWISTTATGTIAYALSARSSISVRPSYTFSESGVGANLSRANLYGGTADWNYLLSEKQSVGIQFGGEVLQESGVGTLTPSAADTNYYTVVGTASRQISPTWRIGGSAGFTISSFALNTTTQRQWFFNGSLMVLKQLGRSSTLGLNYSRAGTVASGLISSSYADRVDVTFENKLSRRFDWRIGAGYLAQVNSGGLSAWYANANAEFLLAPRAGIFATATYTITHQDANVSPLFQGDTNLAFFGISWRPARSAGH
jgi:hypothetical protein